MPGQDVPEAEGNIVPPGYNEALAAQLEDAERRFKYAMGAVLPPELEREHRERRRQALLEAQRRIEEEEGLEWQGQPQFPMEFYAAKLSPAEGS